MSDFASEEIFDFQTLEFSCQLIDRLADTFPAESEEFRALRSAIKCLADQAIEVQRKTFTRFKQERRLDLDTLTRIDDWIQQNPESEIGSLITVNGEAFVLCESIQKGRYLSKVAYN